MDGTPANLAFVHDIPAWLCGHQEPKNLFSRIYRHLKHHFTISSCLCFCCTNNRIIISFLHVRIRDENLPSFPEQGGERLEILRYVAMFTLYSYWLSIIRYVLLSNDLNEFQPLFLKVKQSLYSERYTFMTGLTQDTVLGFHVET